MLVEGTRWPAARRLSLKRKVEELSPHGVKEALDAVYGDGLAQLSRKWSATDVAVEQLSSPGCDRVQTYVSNDEPPLRSVDDLVSLTGDCVRRLNASVLVAEAQITSVKESGLLDDDDWCDLWPATPTKLFDDLDDLLPFPDLLETSQETVERCQCPDWLADADDAPAEIVARRHSLVGNTVAVPGKWWVGASPDEKRRLFKCKISGVVENFTFAGKGSRQRNRHKLAFELEDLTDNLLYYAAPVDVANFVKANGINPPDVTFSLF